MRVAGGAEGAQGDGSLDGVSDFVVRRIAKSLGVPPAALMDGDGIEPRTHPSSVALMELRALLHAFLQLEEPAARRRCVALAEAELARQLRRDMVSPSR